MKLKTVERGMRLLARLILIAAVGVAGSRSIDAWQEGAMGSYPVPPAVRMSGECPGYVIASGIVSQADHEAQEGFANVGENFGLSMRPQSPLYQRVLELRGKPVDVVLRPLPPRTPERLEK